MFSNGKRSLVGDLFGLSSAMSYGLFTGGLLFRKFLVPVILFLNYFDNNIYLFIFMMQFCSRNLAVKEERRLMCKSCLGILDYLLL